MEPASIFQALAALEQANKAGVVCTIVRSRGSTPRRAASKMLVYPDGHILGTVGGGLVETEVIQQALEALADGETRLLSYNMSDPSRGDPGVCGGQLEVYVEPVLPRPTLLVIGAGHVGKALAHLGAWVGYHVAVSDDRPDFCTPEAVPDGHAFYPMAMAELPAHLEIDAYTDIILTTRGVDVDVAGLPVLLAAPAGSIGIIGSQRRWATTRKQLLERGVSEARLMQVYSPVGLELNAETPEEIAVSIIAELILRRRGGKALVGHGLPMSSRKPPKPPEAAP
jgi:xanthine dehydrogenase accessory factor